MHIITDALPILPADMVTQAVEAALAEDWQSNGDITSQAVIPPNAQAHAIIRARENGVLAGLDLAEAAFLAHASGLKVNRHMEDGAKDLQLQTNPLKKSRVIQKQQRPKKAHDSLTRRMGGGGVSFNGIRFKKWECRSWL